MKLVEIVIFKISSYNYLIFQALKKLLVKKPENQPSTSEDSTVESEETNLRHWIERFELLKEIMINLVIFSVVGSVAFVFWYEWQREPVIIEPLNVPESFTQQGYSGAVLASRLMDNLTAHIEASYDKLPDDQKYLFPVEVTDSDLTDSLKVDIPDTGMSLNIIIQYIRRIRGKETRINGDLVGDKDNFELTIRVKGKTKFVKGNLALLNNSLGEMAEYLIENTQPYFLALHYYAEKDYDKALVMVKKTLANKDSRDDSFAYDLWGSILTRKKKYDQAIEKYKLSIKINPENDSPYLGMGYAYYRGYKNYAEAIKSYQTVIQRNTHNYSAYNDLALVLASQGNKKHAIANFKKSIMANPDYANAYYNLGLLFLGDNNYQQAIEQFQKITELNYNESNYFKAYNGLCYSLSQEKKYADAIKNCNLAIQIKPKDDNIYDTLGSVYLEKKEYAQAIVNYQTALSYNPDNTEAHQHLAEVFAITGKCTEATTQLNFALKLDKTITNAKIQAHCDSGTTKKATLP